ncbi:TRAP transporter small permease [Flavimaricola marinus]|uniref:TRAP transporter small permease protein n=1 Tax=Flavimaricola marinus TaxID=1819565 RepID=A0A238LHQ7_9RHOB|nr:TRAP transporter small permease subunit [Flavimaricola marinus]SMY09132.1 Tripartite ATP-independent periplasmic transporters, DctQ component [Flavimaricola marinus]
MAVLFGVLWPLERLNNGILAVCRVIAILALVIMVCLILGQVFFRYVLNDAPAWTEEGARFGMLWMTGLMAPLAYRRGGFVAIDMLERALPRLLSGLLSLALLALSLWVLIVMLDKGINNHVFSLSGRGNSPSLRIPLNYLGEGWEAIRFKNSWVYAGLATGVALLILVNIELMLRQVITLLGGGDRLSDLTDPNVARAD